MTIKVRVRVRGMAIPNPNPNLLHRSRLISLRHGKIYENLRIYDPFLRLFSPPKKCTKNGAEIILFKTSKNVPKTSKNGDKKKRVKNAKKR